MTNDGYRMTLRISRIHDDESNALLGTICSTYSLVESTNLSGIRLESIFFCTLQGQKAHKCSLDLGKFDV